MAPSTSPVSRARWPASCQPRPCSGLAWRKRRRKIVRQIEFRRISRGHRGDVKRIAAGGVVTKQDLAQADRPVVILLLQGLPGMRQGVALDVVSRGTAHSGFVMA